MEAGSAKRRCRRSRGRGLRISISSRSIRSRTGKALPFQCKARKRKLKRYEPWSAGTPAFVCLTSMHREAPSSAQNGSTSHRFPPVRARYNLRPNRCRRCGTEDKCKTFSLRLLPGSAICSNLSKAQNLLQPSRVFPSQESPRDKSLFIRAVSACGKSVSCSRQGGVGTHRGEDCPQVDLRSTSLVACRIPLIAGNAASRV